MMPIPDATLAQIIVATSADAIVAADAKGAISFWNPGAERIFGYSRDEAIGQSLDIIIPERLRERHWTGYDRVMETGESRYGDGDLLAVPGLRKDGTTISIEFTVIPLKGPAGEMLGMATIIRDVTARFEELRALRRKVAAQKT